MTDIELSGHHLRTAAAYLLGASSGRVRDFFEAIFLEDDQKVSIVTGLDSLCKGWSDIPSCGDFLDGECQAIIPLGITPEQAERTNIKCAQKYGFPVRSTPTINELINGLLSMLENPSVLEAFRK